MKTRPGAALMLYLAIPESDLDCNTILKQCRELAEQGEKQVLGAVLLDMFRLKKFRDRFAIIQYLLEQGVGEIVYNQTGLTILHKAILSQDLEATQWLLEKNSFPIDVKDKNGFTPLQYLVKRKGDPAIASLLIKNGADFNSFFAHNQCGITPLHYVAIEGYTELAEVLLKTPGINLHSIIQGSAFTAQPLECAILNRQDEVATLLIKHGADINPPSSFFPPIKGAIYHGNKRLSATLLRQSLQCSAKTRKDVFKEVANSVFSDLVKTILSEQIKKTLSELINSDLYRQRGKIKVLEEQHINRIFNQLQFNHADTELKKAMEKGFAFLDFCHYIPKRNEGAEFKKSFTFFCVPFNFGYSKTDKINGAITYLDSLLDSSIHTDPVNHEPALQQGELSTYIKKLR